MPSPAHDDESASDPLVQRRTTALREASRLVSLAEFQLRAAEITGIDFHSLRGSLAVAEQSITGSDPGQVQGRRRYRAKRGRARRQSPATELCLFIDESGSWLPPTETDGDDWFALGAVAMTRRAINRYMTTADEIKMAFFGDPCITFHEPQMRRGELKFDFVGDTSKTQQFAAAVDLLVSEAEFTAFGVGIRKRELMARAGDGLLDLHLPADPYALALHLLLERFIDFLAYHPDRPRASIVMESQQARQNAMHQVTVAQTIVQGTEYVAPQGFQRFLIPGVEFVGKQGTHPTELADMLARDVFEWIRSDCRHDPPRWALFQDKFYKRENLRRGKFGLKVFPDSDIAAEVEDNRNRARDSRRRPP